MDKEIQKPKYVLDYENKINNLHNKYLSHNATEIKGKSRAIKSMLYGSDKQMQKVDAWYEKNYPKPKIDDKKINEDFIIRYIVGIFIHFKNKIKNELFYVNFLYYIIIGQ